MSLIARLQDPDDIAAWDNFSDMYAPIIYRSARRSGLQAADADDVVQEVLAAVTHSVSRWIKRDDRGPFRAWLFRIARNTSIDFLTRRKHRPWAAGGDTAAEQLNHVEAPADVSSQFDLELRRTMFVQTSIRNRPQPRKRNNVGSLPSHQRSTRTGRGCCQATWRQRRQRLHLTQSRDEAITK